MTQDMYSKVFGNKIKEARKAAGLSSRELSRISGLTHAAIQKYENGELFPTSDCLIKLCGAMGIPVERLFRPGIVELGEYKKTLSSNAAKKG